MERPNYYPYTHPFGRMEGPKQRAAEPPSSNASPGTLEMGARRGGAGPIFFLVR